MRALLKISAICLLLTACSHNPYLDASLTRYQGKIKSGLRRNWGLLMQRRLVFLGRSGFTIESLEGKAGPPLLNFKATECQMILFFDKENMVSDSSYSGC